LINNIARKFFVVYCDRYKLTLGGEKMTKKLKLPLMGAALALVLAALAQLGNPFNLGFCTA